MGNINRRYGNSRTGFHGDSVMDLQTTPEELFMLIGEREFIKYRQEQLIKKLYTQIDEMAEVITKLREENGKLVKPTDNDTV